MLPGAMPYTDASSKPFVDCFGLWRFHDTQRREGRHRGFIDRVTREFSRRVTTVEKLKAAQLKTA
jgi:hypothetical protein